MGISNPGAFLFSFMVDMLLVYPPMVFEIDWRGYLPLGATRAPGMWLLSFGGDIKRKEIALMSASMPWSI